MSPAVAHKLPLATWRTDQILPPHTPLELPRRSRLLSRSVWAGCIALALILAGAWASPCFGVLSRIRSYRALIEPFHGSIQSAIEICTGEDGRGASHAGYIGLKGDSAERPKRSFFWYFEAQEHAKDAPVILTMGGGPGTSGMANALSGQSHCIITANGTVPNPNAWTKRFNLIALDHPVGAGFSYGTRVNSSRSAAIDAYDFLQKFFHLYPHLAKNQFVISGGSYGGMYVPHIATVIHEQNRAIAEGRGQRGAVHINLESLIISNPLSDPVSHFRWVLHQRCYNTNVYNSTTCQELYSVLPSCLESIQYALENPSVERRVAALDLCVPLLDGDTHGTILEDLRLKCDSPNGDLEVCHPQFGWMTDFFRSPATKMALGVPTHVNWSAVNHDVTMEFRNAGDPIQKAYLLYEPLLKDGIRVLHYIGAQDANCGWPGIFSFLKLLHTPFQDRFINAPDVPWPSKEEATVRVVGEGAGNMTFILLAGAGHFVVKDQPVLVRNIVEHWIANRPFVGTATAERI